MNLEAQNKEIDHPFFYPHGGFMIWIFVVLELLVFGMAFGAFFYMKSLEPQIFLESKLKLGQGLATINTLLLITSGYLLALAGRGQKDRCHKKTGFLILMSALLGIGFLVVKFIEYQSKMDLGLILGTNNFFDFYWILTGFHFAHVIIGVLILFYFSYLFFKAKKVDDNDMSFDTAITYWHMCDLIWVILFPIIYLL